MQPKWRSAFLILAAVGLVALAGCEGSKPPPQAVPPKPAPPAIELAKFDATYRTAKAISAAFSVGVNYERFSELLQAFATEVSIAADRAISPEEKKLVTDYRDLLALYADLSTIWQDHIKFARVAAGHFSIPNGHFSVNDSFIDKYKFKTITRTFGGSKFRFVPSDDIFREIGEQAVRREADIRITTTRGTQPSQ